MLGAGSLLLPVLWALPTPARTWRVVAEGSGDATTIQAGIDSAANGDIVLVSSGRYLENIEFHGKAIQVRSEGGPTTTIIDGSGGALPVARFMHGEGHGSVLSGFTITGGRGMPPDAAAGPNSGGGILIFESEPTVSENIIEGNQAVAPQSGDHVSGAGGGIACRYFQPRGFWSPVIVNNIIRHNIAGVQGGGVYIRGPFSPMISGNTVEANSIADGDGGGIFIATTLGGTRISGNRVIDNHVGDHGGGIILAGESPIAPSISATVDGNIIARNAAGGSCGCYGSGGGLYLSRTVAWVHHNTIVENSGGGLDSTQGGGIVVDIGAPLIEYNIVAFSVNGGAFTCSRDPSPVLRNNLAWRNSGDSRGVGCGFRVGVDGNIVADPFFCNLAAGDYSVAENSPALPSWDRFIGALSMPGCEARVPVLMTTWGGLKALYGPFARGPK